MNLIQKIFYLHESNLIDDGLRILVSSMGSIFLLLHLKLTKYCNQRV
jgi:hypothetical protein